MTINTLSGAPDTSRESQGIDEIISKLKLMLSEALTPKMEAGLRKLTQPTLILLERLLNPETNGTQQRFLSKLKEILK